MRKQNDEVIYPHGTSIENATESENASFQSVGQSKRKIDAIDKALGRVAFADDISLPNMLFCKIKRSIKPHAKIISIDTAEAQAVPGVKCVITGKDFDTQYGIIPWTKDEYPLAKDKVRYIGEGVAAVAATSEEIANVAVKKIRVIYEDLPAVLTASEARNMAETSIVNEAARRGNVTKHVKLEFGNVDKALGASAHVVDAEFYFSNTTHAPIEPHCALADFSPQGKLTLYSATQVPHYLHRTLSEVLHLEAYNIRVIQPPVGGAFGGKSECFDLEFATSLLSQKTGQPVKCLYTREEVFYAHRGRHPMHMHFTCGSTEDGKLTSVKSKLEIDGGAYASFGLVTAFYAGQLLTGPVGMPNYAFEATRYYTNKPACGPKRGHGSVQPRMAFEIHCDMLAEKCGLDPIEFRKKNFVGEHTKTVNGQQINSMGLIECLDKVREKSSWFKKFKKLPYGKGIGVATSMYISGTNYPVYPNDMPQSAIHIKADRSGKITIFSGASDIGQGCNSMLASVVSEELGVRNEHITVVSSDTDLTPVDLGAYSSRVTMMLGHAALEASRKLRHDVQEAVSQYWNADEKASDITKGDCAPKDVLFDDGNIVFSKDTELRASIAVGFQITEGALGTLNYQGSYRTKERGGSYRGGTIGSSPAYSCTAHIAEVDVCTKTGLIKVENFWVAHDCGRAINPMLVEAQIEGSTYMGAAEVNLEEMLYGTDEVRKGMLVGPSLLDYKLPTTLDTANINSYIVEKPDPNGPYGAKEAGEGPLHSSIPAIMNAVYDAIGIRFFNLPLSPSAILSALRSQKHVAT